MLISYEEALLNPGITLDATIKASPHCDYLYKYQSFYDEKDNENSHWISNMEGTFHMSLGSEFEDEKDCKPIFDGEKVIKYLKRIFDQLAEKWMKPRLKDVFDAVDADDSIRKELEDWSITASENWQKKIRIGCFTARPDNEKMWEKYADGKRGYCIEYDTKRNNLFKLLTMPVIYLDKSYDLSEGAAIQIFIELWNNICTCDDNELGRTFPELMQRQRKLTYIPVFVKNAKRYSFEEEYRMFFPEHITSEGELLCWNDFHDSENNIDLSNAVNAIYLGEEFRKNAKAAEWRNKITEITKQNGVQIHEL